MEHTGNKTTPTFNEISKTLQSVIEDCYSRVFSIIDALDECTSTDTTRYLLREIFKLQNHIGINLFATSHFIPEIGREFDGSMLLEICASNHDVQRFVKGHMLGQYCV